MAVAAESCSEPLLEPYQFVDDIEAVRQARDQERHYALGLLAARDEQCSVDAGPRELLPIDALSTAHKVLEAESTWGTGSERHQELRAGLVLDSKRLLAEWYRKKLPEYFEPLRHTFDEITGDFCSNGLSVHQMTRDALVPMPDNPEETTRRVNETIEDATPQIMRRLGKIALGTQAIRTLSLVTDKAQREFAEDMAHNKGVELRGGDDFIHRGYDGYVPEIDKFMIRDTRLDPFSKDRFMTQVALPGTYITQFIISMALEQRGLQAEHMHKTELHGAQMLVGDDIFDFIAQLDQIASEQWCTEIFMGEQVEPGTIKNYYAFREQAIVRQKQLEGLAEATTRFVLRLARDKTGRKEALTLVEDFVKLQLLGAAKKDLSIAEQMFDERTARGLMEVAYLESLGRYDEAYQRQLQVEQAAPGGGYCGSGCGLESVLLGDDDGSKKLREILGVHDGDTVVRDKVRSCKCGRKNIVYAYNKDKVTKYCEGCHAHETRSGNTVAGMTETTKYAVAA